MILHHGRSIGDGDLKGCGVTAEPEVEHFDLQPSDAFLVLATDGLWDTLSNQTAVNLICDTVKEPTMCAQRLVTEAITKGSGRLSHGSLAFARGIFICADEQRQKN